MKSLSSKKLEYNCTECFNNIAVLKVDEGKKESLFLFKIWQIHSLFVITTRLVFHLDVTLFTENKLRSRKLICPVWSRNKWW